MMNDNWKKGLRKYIRVLILRLREVMPSPRLRMAVTVLDSFFDNSISIYHLVGDG